MLFQNLDINIKEVYTDFRGACQQKKLGNIASFIAYIATILMTLLLVKKKSKAVIFIPILIST